MLSPTVPHVANASTADDAQVTAVVDALVTAVVEGIAGNKEVAAETAPAACDSSSISAEGENDAVPQPVATKLMRCETFCKET